MEIHLPRSQVGIIKQNSRIEWDESGIKAAAATMMGGVGRGLEPQPRIKMIVDHPFFFALRDASTGAASSLLDKVLDPRKMSLPSNLLDTI